MQDGKQKYVVAGIFHGLPGAPARDQTPMAGALIGVSVAGGARTNVIVPESGILPPVAISNGQKVKFTFEGVGGDTHGAAINPVLMRKHIGQTIGEVGIGGWRFTWRAMDWWAPARSHVSANQGKRVRKHIFKHLVRHGETLSGIAHHFKTTVSAIRADNRLKSDRIYAGRYLYIYGSKPSAARHSSNPITVPASGAETSQPAASLPASTRTPVQPPWPIIHGNRHNGVSARSANGDGHPIHLINPPRNPDLFDYNDGVNGLRYIYNKYGREMASIIEKMYATETTTNRPTPSNHGIFSSSQYKHCGTGGMEAHGGPPYYGWTSSYFTDLPVGTWSAFEGPGLSAKGGSKQVTDRKKRFVVFPSVASAMEFKTKYIIGHGGNWARWNSTDPKTQKIYREQIKRNSSRIVDSFK